MIRLRQAVVVEGRYDKIRLSSLLDALIIPTDGFGLFKNQEKLALLRRLAVSRGLIVLTDSDAAGFLIRNRLKSMIPQGEMRHAFIPDRPGKEKRKRKPSAEGTLGVEGMDTATLLRALEQAGVQTEEDSPVRRRVTKADFMAWGLSGTPDAAAKRKALQQMLDLPARMSANTLLEVLDRLYDFEQIEAMATQHQK